MIFSKDDELLETYKRLRNIQKALNELLLKHVSKKSLFECAKKLGLARGKVLVFDSPVEISVLEDYCLYSARMGGKNAIELYMERTPPPPESDEMRILQAMLDSHFSIFMVEKVYAGRGVSLSSFGEEEVLLMDVGLGDSAVPGVSLAGRVLPFPNFCMFTGVALPVYDEPVNRAVLPVLEKWLINHPDVGRAKFSAGLSASFSAEVIRVALRAGALKSVKHADIEG
jgi:hypothetical protein